MSEDFKRDRALIAERIMGWHKEDSDAWGSQWIDEDGFPVCEVIDWQPDTDIEQAMQVVEGIRKNGLDVCLYFHCEKHTSSPYSKRYACEARSFTGKAYHIYDHADTLTDAIFSVAVSVAEGKEPTE